VEPEIACLVAQCRSAVVSQSHSLAVALYRSRAAHGAKRVIDPCGSSASTVSAGAKLRQRDLPRCFTRCRARGCAAAWIPCAADRWGRRCWFEVGVDRMHKTRPQSGDREAATRSLEAWTAVQCVLEHGLSPCAAAWRAQGGADGPLEAWEEGERRKEMLSLSLWLPHRIPTLAPLSAGNQRCGCPPGAVRSSGPAIHSLLLLLLLAPSASFCLPASRTLH
jgi:hypothetical protein